MSTLKFARTTATLRYNGQVVRIAEDDPWLADDPIVRAHPELFASTPVRVYSMNGVVEQATAAPGERRNVRRA